MALTNIELYEQLRKDVSEESARMIAEVFPSAAALTTKDDFAALEGDFRALKDDFAALRAQLLELELRIEKRFSEFERRVFRWGLTFALPIWAALVAALVKIVIKI